MKWVPIPQPSAWALRVCTKGSLLQAIVLCEYLTQHQQAVKDRRVLELGAGTGLVGMVAALAGQY